MKIENSSEMSHNIDVVNFTSLHWFYFSEWLHIDALHFLCRLMLLLIKFCEVVQNPFNFLKLGSIILLFSTFSKYLKNVM